MAHAHTPDHTRCRTSVPQTRRIGTRPPTNCTARSPTNCACLRSVPPHTHTHRTHRTMWGWSRASGTGGLAIWKLHCMGCMRTGAGAPGTDWNACGSRATVAMCNMDATACVFAHVVAPVRLGVIGHQPRHAPKAFRATVASQHAVGCLWAVPRVCATPSVTGTCSYTGYYRNAPIPWCMARHRSV